MATAQDVAPPETKDYYPPPNSALKGEGDMPKTFSRPHLTALGNLHCALHPCEVFVVALVLKARHALMGLHALLGGRQWLTKFSAPVPDRLASFQRVAVLPPTGVLRLWPCRGVPRGSWAGPARGGGCPNWKACEEWPSAPAHPRKIHVGESLCVWNFTALHMNMKDFVVVVVHLLKCNCCMS